VNSAADKIADFAAAFRGGEAVTCQYFAMCANVADRLLPCGPLGEVPTCGRCAARVKQIEEAT
jgi:hypothetical protein